MPKIFTSEDKKSASNLLLEGASPKVVANQFGVHVSTIYELRKSMGHGHSKPHRASHVVNARLSDDELQALDAFVVDAGMASRNAALRSLIRSATGFLELKRSDYLDLSEVRSELKAQGTNLNQIAHALNKSALMGGAVLSEQDKAFLRELKNAHTMVDGLVSKTFAEVRQQGRNALHTAEKL